MRSLPGFGRALPVVCLTVALSGGLLAGCGGDDSDGDSDRDAGDSSQTEPAGDADGTDSPDSPDETDAAPAAANFADCSAITAEEMAPVLGTGTGSSEVPPLSESCTYSLDDPTQPSVNIEQFTTADFADGWEGAKGNVANTAAGAVEGDPVDLSGIGDGAVAVVGVGPLDATTSIGLVLLGDTIVRATTLPGSAMDDAALLAVTEGVLELVASKA